MTGRGPVKLSFEDETRRIPLSDLIALKTLRAGVKESKKYAQILSSVRAIGLVEAPVVTPNPSDVGRYFLLDGQLRVEALRDLGATEVECIISTDDESYTYNKRINRLAAIQEHRMIRRAIERGAPEDKIAEALGLEVASIHRRSRMLNGICREAIEILKDAPCPIAVFDILRRMSSIRQIEVAEFMIGQNNFTVVLAKAALAATPESQLVKVPAKRPASVSSEQIARMERELASLQMQVKSVEDRYGVDNLHLTVARAYIRTLLGNDRVARWISQHRPEYLNELQAIGEIETIAPLPEAAE
ncbi:plasmid partitioning protein RepB C-terminal domain-containing protein [Pseudorhodoplanes sp.]|uniref:plasmid partitioning protein RepB C-terminal domain-containing protein n=1 Tax=Pseudorhodoplanes sp. TaxID=1934341 RepID=UPI002B683347|nr:plasmid partitioning protein RepB C-terminal domain-containing protein [Pseudorhodoplanes sp.]HWV53487.1 plasmid partitioning protein RepB C-terminal domain-containing protein [Pseudorhodoplanes sp.]